MIYSVFILPNSSDDWETSSPFSTLLSAGQLGYCFSNTTESNLSNYKLISSKLLDVSEINQSVDIFTGSENTVKSEMKINGIGGVANSSDFSFTLEKSNVSCNLLLGRQIKVALDITNDSVKDIGESGVNIVFTGRIRKVKPSLNSVEFSCNGLLAILKDREVGTLTNYPSDVYKSKIVPIVYGDFTDDNAMVRAALNKNVGNFPDIILDSLPLKDVTALLFWDSDNKYILPHSDISELNLSVDKNAFDLSIPTNKTLIDSIDETDDTIKIFNPNKIAFEVTGTPSIDTTSVYTVNSHYYQFLEVKDEYYIFTILGSSTLPHNSTGTLTHYSGTNGGSISYTWHSDVLDPDIFLEQSGEEGSTVSSKTKPLILKINSEYMLVFGSSIFQEGVGIYSYTLFNVVRGWNSITSSHSNGDEVLVVDGDLSSTRWTFKHILWCCNLSSFWQKSSSNNLMTLDTGSLNDLTSMYRTGALGDYVVFRCESLDYDVTMYIDLHFPKINIKAEIIDAFILGGYASEYFSSSGPTTHYHESTISLIQDGITLTDGYLEHNDGFGAATANSVKAGIGKLVLLPIIIFSSNTFPFFLKSGVNYTISVLATQSFKSPNMFGSDFSKTIFNTHAITDFYKYNDLESYSLKNNIEKDADNVLYRNASLGELSSFLDNRLAIKMYHLPSNGNTIASEFTIANPGLLLHLAVNPLESEVFIRGIGRHSLGTPYEKPQSILIDILDKELDFTDVNDNVSDTRDTWKQAIALNNNIIKFSALAQSICEQGGLILSDNSDGGLNINSITPPEDTSVLTVLTLSSVLLKSDIPDIKEEWTTIDRLITDFSIVYQKNDASDSYGLLRTANDIGSSEITDNLSTAAAILEDDRMATIETPYIRDTTTVDALAQLVTDYSTSPLRILTLGLNLSYYGLKVGQWVICNIDTVGKVYLIISYSIDFNFGVTIKMIEKIDHSVLFDTPDSSNVYIDTPDSTNQLIGG